MAVDELGDVDVLDGRDIVDRGEAGHAADTTTGGAEEVAEDPVVARVPVHEAAADGRHGFRIFVLLDHDRTAEDVYVLDEAEGAATLQLAETGEDDAGAEGVSDQGDGTHAEVAVDEGVGEDEAGSVGAVERDGPRVVEEIGELREDDRELEGGHERDEDGGAEELLERLGEDLSGGLMIESEGWERGMIITSVARILIVCPMEVNISGSQCTENRSPMMGSTVEYGNRTSSTFPFIHLLAASVPSKQADSSRRSGANKGATHPDTVMIKLTLFALCSGRYSNVSTLLVRL